MQKDNPSMSANQNNEKRNFFAAILLSPEERRLRAGWRLLMHVLILLLVTLLLGVPINYLFPDNGPLPAWVEISITGIAITTSVILARRFIDHRSLTSLGLGWNAQAAKDILAGIGIGALIMSAILLIELAAGWLTLEGFGWQIQPPKEFFLRFLVWGFIFLAVGFYEELLSRGYHLQNMEEGTNAWIAVFLSSAIFGIAHISNPNATYISALGITLAGFFLAYPYFRTRQLWLSIGLHIGWNFFEGPVLGFPVSGLDTPRLLRHVVSGPVWATGGKFGPEAGLVLLPAMAIGTLLVYWYTQGRITEK